MKTFLSAIFAILSVSSHAYAELSSLEKTKNSLHELVVISSLVKTLDREDQYLASKGISSVQAACLVALQATETAYLVEGFQLSKEKSLNYDFRQSELDLACAVQRMRKQCNSVIPGLGITVTACDDSGDLRPKPLTIRARQLGTLAEDLLRKLN